MELRCKHTNTQNLITLPVRQYLRKNIIMHLFNIYLKRINLFVFYLNLQLPHLITIQTAGSSVVYVVFGSNTIAITSTIIFHRDAVLAFHSNKRVCSFKKYSTIHTHPYTVPRLENQHCVGFCGRCCRIARRCDFPVAPRVVCCDVRRFAPTCWELLSGTGPASTRLNTFDRIDLTESTPNAIESTQPN